MDPAASPARRAADAFVAELRRWRTGRGLSKKQLAVAMNFDPSYVSHVEAGRHRPTEDFARRAELVLQAGGLIWQRFQEYDRLRGAARTRPASPAREVAVPEQWLPPGTGLVVDREVAELSYDAGIYHCRVRRVLYNAGTEPVTRYPARVDVDRYPGQPDRSNRHYRDNPLTWDELGFTASSAGEPMTWRPKTDRDAFKEVWLLFENDQGRFPLYPGQRAPIEYAYSVGADKWGQWFQRAVRLPTRQLTIRLDFPLALAPAVWGTESSLSTDALPLRTPIAHEVAGERSLFTWHTDSPRLHAWYRLEWRFRADAPSAAGAVERMRAAGIVQRGAEVLTTRATPYDLPRERGTAEQTVDGLLDAIDRVSALHPFSKGIGLAAPQLGIARATAVVRPAQPGQRPVVLINPRIVAAATDCDERYEGCLSFFDVRGLVERPLWVDVESANLHGERSVTRYERDVARLVAHEVDHLEGRLYLDRMRAGAPLVSLDEYRDSGQPWRY